jgi:phosphatidylinositol-bisphosphatase
MMDTLVINSFQVWISLTAFLHYISQQKLPSKPVVDQAGMTERLGMLIM